MKTIIAFSLFVASCSCLPGWGNQGAGSYGPPSRGIPRSSEGGWGNVGGQGYGGHQGGGGQGGSWGQAGGQGAGWGGAQGKGLGQGGAWGQKGGSGWRLGRSSDDSQYGATIIDTPDMYGYEATIPGAQSRFIGYRGARSGQQGFGRGYDQQGSQGQGQGGSGHGSWSQGGHQY